MKIKFLLLSTLIIALLNLRCQSGEDYFKSGHNKLIQKDYKGSIDDLTKSIRVEPNNWRSYNNRALAKWG